MNAGKLQKFNAILIMVVLLLAACGPKATPSAIPSNTIENIDITENNTVLGQITQTKFFNQCDAAGPITATVQFSESSTNSSQKELVISEGAEIGAAIPGGIANAKIQGAIEAHFIQARSTGTGYQESVQITIPAHTQQEYTIIWQETRREGTVTYTENEKTKSANYSYRIGLAFLSSAARNIDCSIPVTEAPTDIPATDTPVPTIIIPAAKPLSAGCMHSTIWQIGSTDQSTLNSLITKPDGCYDTGALGIFPDRSGILHIVDGKKRNAITSGIYTPINSDSVIEFNVHVNSMYIANPNPPVYVAFAIAPAGDPLTGKNTARFKLQVEDKKDSALIYFVLADVGENIGAKFKTQHYEYGRTYTIRFELTGSIMSIFINNIKLNESLSIPAGSKVFYIGYDSPPYAGVDVEITNVKIDGALK